MSDKRAQAIWELCRRHAERSGVTAFPVQRTLAMDAHEVRLHLDGLFLAMQIPRETPIECVDLDVAGAVGLLCRQVKNYREGWYDPEIGSPCKSAWRADRENWLASRDGRPLPYTTEQLMKLSRARVVAVDRATGTVKVAVMR